MATSIEYILRTDKTNKKGLSPLYLRVIKDRKVAYISLGGIFYLNSGQWDESNQQVKKNHPNATLMNNRLLQMRAKTTDIVLDLERAGNDFNVQDIKKNLIGENRHDSFIDYLRSYIARLEKDEKVGTRKKATSVLNNLLRYLDGRNLTFNQLDHNFLERYENYQREKKPPLSTNTIHSNLKQLRKLVNDAIREGIISADKNPFILYKLKKEDREKFIYLEEDELTKVENAKLDDKRLTLIRDVFIFSVYAAGIRVSDVLTLRKSNFDGEHIRYKSRKTRRWCTTKLPQKAINIIKKYSEHCNEENGLIFPFLNGRINWDDKTAVFNAISSGTATYNKGLKKVALKAKVKNKLHSHVARHTFATLGLSKEIPIEHVSKLLGHKDVHTTLGYAKYRDVDLDRSMEKFDS